MEPSHAMAVYPWITAAEKRYCLRILLEDFPEVFPPYLLLETESRMELGPLSRFTSLFYSHPVHTPPVLTPPRNWPSSWEWEFMLKKHPPWCWRGAKALATGSPTDGGDKERERSRCFPASPHTPPSAARINPGPGNCPYPVHTPPHPCFPSAGICPFLLAIRGGTSNAYARVPPLAIPCRCYGDSITPAAL